jgi:HK97 family phage portal protein
VTVVRSFGALQSIADTPVAYGTSGGSLNLYGDNRTYAAIWRTQPNVRTVVDFLARNIAQLGIHVFRRLSDNDRERLPKHELAGIIQRPNPGKVRFRLIEDLVADLGVYFNAYWLKVRTEPLGVLRLPAHRVSVGGDLVPTLYVYQRRNGDRIPFAPSEIVHFGGFNPCDDDNPLQGVSPLETLRRILAEEAAAGAHREAFWTNAARVEGVVTRPKEKPRYNPDQVRQWREQWQGAYAGGGGGKTVLLQDGETFTPTSWSAKDSEYLGARKLTREECAAAYHVPLPMVGILDHATFSNIKEQHKQLYQDCLGPWLVMIEEEIERQLLPECTDTRDVYVEFNIAEKLKGSFEEQAASILTLVGRPVMTANEGRGRLNLPSMKDDPSADRLAAQQGGPSDATANPTPDPGATEDPPAATPPMPKAAVDVAPVIKATRDRQHARLAKLSVTDRPAAFTADLDRWNRELATDLATLTTEDEAAHAAALNAEMLQRLENDARDARLAALERRPKVVGIEREYVRDPSNGLVQKHIDRPIEESV